MTRLVNADAVNGQIYAAWTDVGGTLNVASISAPDPQDHEGRWSTLGNRPSFFAPNQAVAVAPDQSNVPHFFPMGKDGNAYDCWLNPAQPTQMFVRQL